MSQIIILHGASSSGKTTLARAVQQRTKAPFWHISIDHLRDTGVLPMQRFRTGEFDWSDSRSAIFEGFHRSLAAYANAGNNLIVEHILDTPGWIETLKYSFAAHDVLFVALHCTIDVLRQRELARGNREIGSAVRDQQTIHLGRVYDLELDATDDIDANVTRTLEALKSRERRSEFHLPVQP